MSTEPGKSKGGPGAGGAGADGAGGKPGAKPGRTVAAASAKSSRDETTVEIDSPDTAAPESGTDSAAAAPGTEETRTDMASLSDEPEKSAGSSEIAPVKDTTETPEDKDAKPASPPEKPAAPKAAAPAAAPSETTPAPAASASGSGPAGWAKPAEPSGSVSTGRTEQPAKPFNPGSTSPAAGNSSSAGQGDSGRSNRPSFASAVLKNRQSPSAAANTSSKPATTGKPARKAQLQLARLEPWSVMKFSFVMAVVCFVILLVAVIVLYAILAGLGVFDAISDTINSLTREQGETTGTVDAGDWFSFFRIFGYTVLVGALNVLLITALSTVGSVIYNLAADLVGGVEVTLKEAE